MAHGPVHLNGEISLYTLQYIYVCLSFASLTKQDITCLLPFSCKDLSKVLVMAMTPSMWPLLPTIVISMALIYEQELCIWYKGCNELSWEAILHGSLRFLYISGAEVLMAFLFRLLFQG